MKYAGKPFVPCWLDRWLEPVFSDAPWYAFWMPMHVLFAPFWQCLLIASTPTLAWWCLALPMHTRRR